MSDKIQMTVAGNLVADPEIRATPNGNVVTHFTVASTPRQLNQKTGQWQDGQTSFMRCQVWRDQAENVAESLHKGDRVVVSGTLSQRSWTDENQQKHSVWELQAEDVAASMKFAQVQVNRQRANQRQSQQASEDHTAPARKQQIQATA
ncbi:single-stranded DNA-binding protein [Nocardia sp. NPDC046473]|uniref:single-stranded DNA-binding protein n=1 Tax=Nocardia sp. NPDC046473 TaxID=3155733 RepID=UPI0033CEB00A